MAKLAILVLLILVAVCLAAPSRRERGTRGGGSGYDGDGGYNKGDKDNHGDEMKGPQRLKRHYHDELNDYGGDGYDSGGLAEPAYGGLDALPLGNSQSYSKSSASASSMSSAGGGYHG